MTGFYKGGVLAALIILLIGGILAAEAAEAGTVRLFVREDCTHCQEAREFLNELMQEQPQVRVQYYDLAKEENQRLFEQVAATYNLQRGTPIALIKGVLTSGFDSSETTGRKWRELLAGQGRDVSFADIASGGANVAGALSAGLCSED